MKQGKALSVVFGVFAALVFAAGSVSATVIRVPEDYPKVRLAIDAASSGDTVLVAGGRYAWSTNGEVFPIRMKNGVRLIGAGAPVCTLDAEGTSRVILCVFISDTATRIEGFTLTNGFSVWGSGIYCYYSSPTITNNVITGNIGSRYAGGMWVCYDSFPTITHNVITGNSCKRRGGGIWVSYYSSPTITGNVIADNNADWYGGGIECFSSCSPTIANNLITGNTAPRGGGGGISCIWDSSPTITNNVLIGNSAGQHGGGIACFSCPYLTITNNIITGNSSPQGGGIFSYDSSPSITYDDVWGNTPNDYWWCGPGIGCISTDPLFVDPTAGDYHLQPGSPCIDAGDNNAPGLPEFDFDGNPRIMDGDGDGIAVVDMGAFEYRVPVIPVTLVTGGGWIPGDPPGSGNKRTFGFNVHFEAGAVRGQLQFNDHGTKMKVHSDTMKTLVIQPGDTIANFSGDCWVDGVSGYSFECEVMDRGEPGHGVDKFTIDIYDAVGKPCYSAGDFLGGGNIQIHEIGEEGTQVLSVGSGLSQNSPNPFGSSTVIRYHLPSACRVRLNVYDLTGKLVRTLLNGTQTAGHYAVEWNGKDSSGRKVTTGIYIYRLTAGRFSRARKMVVLK